MGAANIAPLNEHIFCLVDVIGLEAAASRVYGSPSNGFWLAP
jgi:hypothetical protein